MHPLLRRQLRKILGAFGEVPAEFEPLLTLVSAAYEQNDTDRTLLERSLDLTSRELLEANADLRRDQAELEARVAERTAELRNVHAAAQRELAERRKTEETLRAAQHRYKVLVERSPIAILHGDAEGRCLHVNKTASEMMGLSPEEMLGNGWLNALYPADRESFYANWLPLLQETSASSEPFELNLRLANGREMWIHASTVALRDTSGTVTGYVGTMIDVTMRKLTDETIRASEERYRTLFENSLDAIYISTIDGRLIDINPAGVALLGYFSKDAVLELDLARDVYADTSARGAMLEEMRTHGAVKDYELELKRPDGTTRTVMATSTLVPDTDGKLTLLRGILRDVSEQRQLERQLLQSQKLEAVGRLAGGVAHDFNNLLTAIIGNSDLLSFSLPGEQSHLLDNVREIKEAATRGAALTAQLLAFSRKQVVTPQTLDLNRTTLEMEALLRRIIGSNIDFVTELTAKPLYVRADRTQIEQVILNLCVNARDAMPGTGLLTIRTRDLELTADSTRGQLSLEPGRYALIEVIDTGEGIDQSIKDQIFEPFVTSKGSKEGTGLGLATVYGIVQQSNGHIEVSSVLGEGTTFRIYLPQVDESPEAAVVDEELVPERGRGMILLVEDDAAVRTFIERSLSGQGYEVHCTESGTAALDFVETHNLDLLITDVVMPKMNGVALATRVRKRRPNLPVLLISGHAEIAGAARIDHDALSKFAYLQKPFSSSDLARRLKYLIRPPEEALSADAASTAGESLPN